MKRVLIVLMLTLMLGVSGAMFAQTTGLDSALSQTSFGVFENELDAALTVQESGSRPGFSELENMMIFGGLANLNFADTVRVRDTYTATSGSPLWVGAFVPGDTPVSVFSGSFFDGANNNQADGTTVDSTATKAVTDGTTTTTYRYVDQETEEEFTRNRMFDTFEQDLQLISRFGDINVGLGLGFDIDNSTVQANNYSLTEKHYYDAQAADTTVAPDVQSDYTYTEDSENLNRTVNVSVDVPAFLSRGEVGHLFRLGTGLTFMNQSSELSESYSTPQNTALTLTGGNTVTESDVTTNKSRTFNIYGVYNQNRPGVWNGSGMNELMFGGWAWAAFRSAEYEEELKEQDLTFAGDGTEATKGTRNEETDERTLEGRADFTVSANVGHSFYFDLGGNTRLGFIPRFNLELAADRDNYLISERVEVDRNDNDADGAFDSAADRIITATTEYTNTDNGFGAAQDVFEVSHMFQLAGAIEFQPGDWPIQIVMGSRPRLEVSHERTKTLARESTTTTKTVDGTGADQGTTVVQNASTGETSVWSHGFTVAADHNIGLGIDVSDAVRVDVQLDLSSETNVLDFKDLVAQVIVKLP